MNIFVGISLIILLVLLIQNKIKPAFLFFGLLLLYYFLDLIKLDKMLSGFINSSLITLLLLLIISIVFEKTFFITTISNKLFSKSYTKSLLKLSFFTSISSAFLNNTAVVASMMSVVKQNKFHSPSKLLLPLSFAAIFGGTITLIGTSTNLLINSFMIENNLTPLKIFDFIYVGIPIAFIGAFVLLFISRFLPDIKSEKEIENYFLEVKVLKSSKLIGKSILENKLRTLEYLFLSEILRNDKIISPVNPNEIIYENDILLFSGDIKHIEILKNFDGLELEHINQKVNKNIIEVILSHESTLINKTIKDTNFRTKFNASVIAIKRGNQQLSGKISEIELQAGDNIILAVGEDFNKRDNIGKNFYIISSIGLEKKLDKNSSLIVLFSFLAVLMCSFFEIIPLVKGLFFLLAMFIGFKFITINEIQRRFPYELMLIIGSALGIAYVMLSSGIADYLASELGSLFGSYGVVGAFISIYLFTFLLTEIITNNAAAALSFPIAYSTAIAFDSSILPFVMAVAYGASASFIMPYGYQTNLMVYSAGKYDMKTFLKSGTIVSIVYSILVLVLVPIFFPFK
ncbi:SLC13 family permease [Arcobacter sp.]|uniref:SLC13 family permease n=1 Tax=Arcobacter sp. TaxID=1872629 RepID=UPI003C7831B9